LCARDEVRSKQSAQKRHPFWIRKRKELGYYIVAIRGPAILRWNTDMTSVSARFERLLPALLAFASVLLLVLLVWDAGGLPWYWSEALLHDLRLVGLCAVLLAWLYGRLDPLLGRTLAAATALAYLSLGVGLYPMLAVLLFGLSCWAYGHLLLRLLLGIKAPDAGFSCQLILGLALLLSGFGLLIHVPYNTRLLYTLVLFAPLVYLLAAGKLAEHLHKAWSQAHRGMTSLVSVPWWYGAAALLLTVLIARICFYPTFGFDDVAVHLRLWYQLQLEAKFSFDAETNVWELMPFATDLLHAIVSLVAGEGARGAVNLALLLLLLRQIWVLATATLGLQPRSATLLLMLFLSTPVLGNLLESMQTELFMAVLATTGVRLLCELRGNWLQAQGLALLAISALCCATKLPGALLGLLLVLPIPYFCREQGILLPLRKLSLWRLLLLAGFVLALAALAFNAYATAWWLTGNPVFPLYNGIFKSPFFPPENFEDNRWLHGFSPRSWVELFFRTSAYYETQDYTAGFQYLFLFPLALLLLPLRLGKDLSLRLAITTLGFLLVIFAVTQYWRYLFPVLPLASVALGALLLPGQAGTAGPRLGHGALLVCLALNLWCYPGTSWTLNVPPPHGEHARNEYFAAIAPGHVLNTYLNASAPGSTVLYPTETPYGGSLLGRPVYVNWYAPTRMVHSWTLTTPDELRAFLAEEKIDHVIMQLSDADVLVGLLRQHLAEFGLPLQQQSNEILYRLLQEPLAYRRVAELAVEAAIPDLQLVASAATGGAHAARFRASASCGPALTGLQVRISWDQGLPYSRQVSCTAGSMDFVEALPVPGGAKRVDVYLALPDATAASSAVDTRPASTAIVSISLELSP